MPALNAGRASAESLATDDSRERTDLEDFVATHYARLIRLAGIVSRDVDGAQDAVQTALERAWRHRTELEDPSRLRPWLDRIVVREATRLAQRRRWSFVALSPSVEWIDVAARSPDEATTAAVKAAFAGLSAAHRAVVALHLYAGYSVDETARALDVPADTVRSRLRAARQRLRHALGEVEP
jgi:RNA polymerase sigma-70 factor, ECF subfamily